MSEPVIAPLPRKSLTQSREAVRVLADAFYDDPLYTFLLPDTRRRTSNTAAIMRLLLRVSLPYRHVYVAQGGDASILGTLALVPPGKYPLPTLRMAVASAAMAVTPSLWGKSMGTLARRGRPYMEAVEQLHFPSAHWYLAVIGVAPGEQGKGVGNRLLRMATGLADESRHPLYLETNAERNLALYRRHGFEVVAEMPMPGGGPPIWTMLRERGSST